MARVHTADFQPNETSQVPSRSFGEEQLNSFQSGNVFPAFCFACTKRFHPLVLPSTQEVMKLSCN